MPFRTPHLSNLDEVGLERHQVHGPEPRLHRGVSGGHLGPARDVGAPIPPDALHHTREVKPAPALQRRDHHVPHGDVDLLQPDLQGRPGHNGIEQFHHLVLQGDAPDGHRRERIRRQAGDHLELPVLGPERRKIGPDDGDRADPVLS